MKIKNALEILNGLKPIAHAYSNDLEAQKIIAYDNINTIKLIDLFSDGEAEPKTIKINTDEKIINVISQSFQEIPDAFLLTTKKNNDGFFYNYLCDFDSEPKLIFKSTSTPMLIVDPNELTPLLIYSLDNEIKAGEIIKNTLQTREITAKLKRVPKGIHTSSFVDITGNMHSDVVLHSKENNENYIEFFAFTKGYELNKFNSIKLPMQIGPIMFEEYTNRLSPDMIFISNDDGIFNLNLYPNITMSDIEEAGFPKDIEDYKKSIETHTYKSIFATSIKTNLSTLLPGYDPVLKNDDGSPSGMFLTDLTGKGIKDVFITLKNKATGKHRVVALKYEADAKTFVICDYCDLNALTEFSNISSTTICDYQNSGTQNLIITYTSDLENGNDYSSVPFDFDITVQETGINFLTLLFISEAKNYFIPGSVVTMLYENEEKVCKATLSPQTSFSSLQPYKVFIGLGPTNLFINWALIHTPSYDPKNNSKDAISFLVPNTFAVFTLRENSWRIQSFFSKMHFNFTVGVLICILFVFMVIFIILSVQEKKRYKLVMSKDSTRTVFNAL